MKVHYLEFVVDTGSKSMYDAAWFREDIWFRLANNFYFYLTVNDWGRHAAIIVLILGAFFWFLRPDNTRYRGWISKTNYSFEHSWTALLYAVTAFVIYVVVFYTQEQSLFSNYDTMSNLNTDIFKNGVRPIYGEYERIRPTGFIENNILYAISENMAILNLSVWLSVLLLMVVLYFSLNFIPACKRLIIIGTVILIPAYLQLNNIIFHERIWLLEVIGSLALVKRFMLTNSKLSLAGALIFMNLALYAKETVSLFYGGAVAVLGLSALWNNQVVPKDFLRPHKLLRRFPIEALTALSLLIFMIIFKMKIYNLGTNNYYVNHQNSLLKILWLYRFELAIATLAAGIWLFRTVKKQSSLIENTLITSSLATLVTVTFYLRLYPYRHGDAFYSWRSYYLALPAVFLTIYLLYTLKRKLYFTTVTLIIVLYSLYNASITAERTEGKYYRETAEYLAGEIQKSPHPVIYLGKHSENCIWEFGTWANIFRYYYPDKDIIFNIYDEEKYKNELTLVIYRQRPQDYQPILPTKEPPKQGSFYIIRRGEHYDDDRQMIKNLPHELGYQNRVFEVYKIL